MSPLHRLLVAAVGATTGLVLMAGPALAHQCTNASKKYHESGAQIVFGPNDEVLYITPGLERRIEQGLVDPETGEGYHGIIAFDFDGDGVADGHTYVGVGPEGEIPLEAQFHGPACRGMTNIGVYFDQCV